jgi:hypothetical protein
MQARNLKLWWHGHPFDKLRAGFGPGFIRAGRMSPLRGLRNDFNSRLSHGWLAVGHDISPLRGLR